MLHLFKVRGTSMVPYYSPGEILLCKKIQRKETLHVGQTIITTVRPYGKVLKIIETIDLSTNTCRLKGANSRSLSTAQMGNIPLSRDFYKILFAFGKKRSSFS